MYRKQSKRQRIFALLLCAILGLTLSHQTWAQESDSDATSESTTSDDDIGNDSDSDSNDSDSDSEDSDGGYDDDGYDDDGYDEDGYDEDGYDDDGYDDDGYDEDGYDEDGYDDFGYDDFGYDDFGYDEDGYDEDGYDEDGFDIDGFDEFGFEDFSYAAYATIDGLGRTTGSSTSATSNAGSLADKDKAALSAMQSANSKSITENREYAGLVGYDPVTNSYVTSPALPAGLDSADPRASPLASGVVEVGYYHTHGNYTELDSITGNILSTGNAAKDSYDSLNFSPADKAYANANSDTTLHGGDYHGYVGVPDGNFSRYEPSTNTVTQIK